MPPSSRLSVRTAARSAAWPEALGLAIRDWRKAAGLSTEAAARLGGVTSSTWNRWETADPSREPHLSALVRAGVPVGPLLQWAATLTRSDRLTGRYTGEWLDTWRGDGTGGPR